MAAEKCYDEGLYEAAAILFIKVPSYSRHAQSLLHLNDLSGALESANKAKNADLWLLVASKCVKDGDFSLAKQAGLNLVTKAEKLENLILLYESYGKFSEIISLLEDGIASRSLLNMSIYTNLAILYCKYHREKLLSYIESNLSNINVPKLTKVCIEVKLWKEIIFLYVKIREYDSAIQIIMRESGRFWDHQEFKNIAVNINNYDTREKMIKYYLNEHFDLLTDLLITLGPKLDLRRLIALFENLQCLPVVYSFLETIRDINNPLVNSVYNDMLIEKQDYKSLKSSIDMYSNFNQLELAGKLKTHENFEMRRISAHLYSLNGEKSKSIEISIEDGAYNDAICTVLRASSRELAEPLLASLAQDKKYNWFTLMLCKCHHILDWSLVFELAWMNDLHEYAMPFYAQAIHNLSDRIKTLESTLVDAKDGLPQTRSLLKEDSTNKSSFCLPP